jgi:protein TonB
MDLGKEGQATITCSVKANGTVENCNIDSESPEGMGFGNAAVRLSKLFKMKPQTSDGQPVEGAKVSIPIAFKLAG